MLKTYKALDLTGITITKSKIYTFKNLQKKHYEYTFDYLTTTQFKDLSTYINDYNKGRIPEDGLNLNIIGSVNLTKRFDEKKYSKNVEDREVLVFVPDVLEVDKRAYHQDYSYFEVTDDEDGEPFGYVRVDDYKYIKVYNTKPFPLILWLKKGLIGFGILAFIAIFGFLVKNYLDTNYMPWQQRTETKGTTLGIQSDTNNFEGFDEAQGPQEELEMLKIDLQGSPTVYDNFQEIQLVNSADNNVYLNYQIYLGKELLYNSDLIEPGKEVRWNAFENLEAGEHELVYLITNYDYIVDETGTAHPGEVGSPYTAHINIKCEK